MNETGFASENLQLLGQFLKVRIFHISLGLDHHVYLTQPLQLSAIVSGDAAFAVLKLSKKWTL